MEFQATNVTTEATSLKEYYLRNKAQEQLQFFRNPNTEFGEGSGCVILFFKRSALPLNFLKGWNLVECIAYIGKQSNPRLENLHPFILTRNPNNSRVRTRNNHRKVDCSLDHSSERGNYFRTERETHSKKRQHLYSTLQSLQKQSRYLKSSFILVNLL